MKESSARFNPFPGLRSFEPREEHLFFGRERQIDELLKRLRRTRFLAVVGISGSGKSSLVLSGLIPALHRGLMTRAGSSWRVAIFRPGDDPIGNLATALAQPDVLGVEGDEAGLSEPILEATLRRGALGLVECVREARDVERRIPKYDNVLVVVDQFEELFRLKASGRRPGADDEALAFVRLLQEASRDREVPVYVVLTMRTDFMEHCVEYPGLPESINDGAFIVSRMSREEQRAAIVGPVAVGGGEIAPRLVLRLLNSVGDDPDQLPVLQHALMRTWDYWQRLTGQKGALDIEQYEAVGTMERALSQHAEEVYEDLGTEHRRMIAERMFKALTDKVPGRRGVRRPIQVRELCELTGASPEEVISVVDCFRQPGRSFLMPPSSVGLEADSVIDISHESLMRVWERLIGWVEEETESAQFYLRLARAAALHEEGSGGLWRDPELEFALRWREHNQPSENWAKRYDPSFERNMRFLDASLRQREQEAATQEAQRRSELQRARWLAAASVVVMIVILVFGLYAISQRNQARNQQRIADQERQAAQDERQKAEQERERAEANEREALQQQQLAEEQQRKADQERARAEEERSRAQAQTQIAEANRRQAEQNQNEAREERDRAQQARQAAERAEQEAQRQRAAAVSAKDQAEILRRREMARALAVQTPRLLQEEKQRELAALLAVEAYRLNLANGGEPEAAYIYDALWHSLVALDPERGAGADLGAMVRAVALAPDGTLAAGLDDGRLLLRRPGGEPVPLARSADDGTAVDGPAVDGPAVDGDAIRSLDFSPDGSTLAAGTFLGAVLLWDLETGSMRRLAASSAAPATGGDLVGALAFGSPDVLYSGSLDGEVLRWDLAGKSREELLDPAKGAVRTLALAVSGQGGALAAARDDGSVLILAPGSAGAGPRLDSGRVCKGLAFSPAAKMLACGGDDGAIALWDLDAGSATERVPLRGHTASVNGLQFSPDGNMLASASSDRNVRLWNLRHRNAEPIVLTGHTSWVWTLDWSADGSTLVSGSSDRTVRTWTTHSRHLVEGVCSHLTQRRLSEEEWNRYIGADIQREEVCPPGSQDPPSGANPERSEG